MLRSIQFWSPVCECGWRLSRKGRWVTVVKGIVMEILQARLGVGGGLPFGNSHSRKESLLLSVPVFWGRETASVTAAKWDTEALRHRVRAERAYRDYQPHALIIRRMVWKPRKGRNFPRSPVKWQS